jgi:hypothetical protein
VLHFATGKHYRLLSERFFGPLEKWEKTHGKDVDDETYFNKEAELNADHRIHVEADMRRILARWGFRKQDLDKIHGIEERNIALEDLESERQHKLDIEFASQKEARP